MQLIPRPSQARGGADHGWLKTFHTFSFASYQTDDFIEFGALRVLNEDRVEPHTGFGTHGHREFEIFSYVVSGELEHRDSMGNVEILKRGDIQLTSAGTGIRHSEKAHGASQVHFLQIWTHPDTSKLPPTYYTRHFSDVEKTDKWARVVAPVEAPGISPTREGSGPAPVHSAVTLNATLLSAANKLPHILLEGKAYIHVVQTSGYNQGAAKGAKVRVTGGEETLELAEGDGAFVLGEKGKEVVVENVGDRTAEVLLFDVE